MEFTREFRPQRDIFGKRRIFCFSGNFDLNPMVMKPFYFVPWDGVRDAFNARFYVIDSVNLIIVVSVCKYNLYC